MFDVMYGCVDFADKQVLASFDEEEEALAYAEECAQDQFDEQPSLSMIGWTYEKQEDRVVLLNPDYQEVEWWIVIPQS